MATLLESANQSVTPSVLGALADALDLDEQMVSRGLNVVGPLVQGSLAEISATPRGLDGLVQMMPAISSAVERNDLSGLLDSLTGKGLGVRDLLGDLLGSDAATGGSAGGFGASSDLVGELLDSLFGDGLGSIGATIDQGLGFKISPLLAVVAPLLVNQISKLMKEQNLDTQAVAVLLQKEQQTFLDTEGETAALVRQALNAGKKATALKQKFSIEEWTAIRMGPVAAVAMVMQAAPSGAVGRMQEIIAARYGVAESAARTSPTSLLQTAFATALSADDFKLYTPETPREQLLKAIQNASALVAAKAPASAADYKQMMIIVGAKVAEAAKEGGFLGIGGQQVNNAEKSALAGITAALGELG